jgi:hypothetical protein
MPTPPLPPTTLPAPTPPSPCAQWSDTANHWGSKGYAKMRYYLKSHHGDVNTQLARSGSRIMVQVRARARARECVCACVCARNMQASGRGRACGRGPRTELGRAIARTRAARCGRTLPAAPALISARCGRARAMLYPPASHLSCCGCAPHPVPGPPPPRMCACVLQHQDGMPRVLHFNEKHPGADAARQRALESMLALGAVAAPLPPPAPAPAPTAAIAPALAGAVAAPPAAAQAGPPSTAQPTPHAAAPPGSLAPAPSSSGADAPSTTASSVPGGSGQ